MEANQLPNYGRGYVELVSDPVIARRVRKSTMMPMLKILWQEVGPIGLIQTLRQTNRVTERMLAHDWSDLKKHGFDGYGDDVFYPRAGELLGFCYTRTGTLALGAPVCDFKFERL